MMTGSDLDTFAPEELSAVDPETCAMWLKRSVENVRTVIFDVTLRIELRTLNAAEGFDVDQLIELAKTDLAAHDTQRAQTSDLGLRSRASPLRGRPER